MKITNRTIIYNKATSDTILGLDCSSSVVGWGVTEINNSMIKLLAHGHFKPLDSKYDLLYRLDKVYDEVINLYNLFLPKYIAIEDIIFFMKGKSNAKTITILTAFNRVIGLAIYRINKNITFYSVHEIRNIIKEFYKINKIIKKNEMPNIIKEFICPNFNEILNNNGNILDSTYDEADGIAVSVAKAICLLNI